MRCGAIEPPTSFKVPTLHSFLSCPDGPIVKRSSPITRNADGSEQMDRDKHAPTGNGTLKPTAQQALGNAAKANVEAAIAVASSAATAFVDALVQPRSVKARKTSSKTTRRRSLAKKTATKKPRKATKPQRRTASKVKRKPVAKAQRTPTAKTRGTKARVRPARRKGSRRSSA
jgi:hypothetical protein